MLLIKEYIKENHISIKKISASTGIPYSSVNDMINGIVDISNIKYGYVKRVADYLGMTVDDFAGLFVVEGSKEHEYDIVVKNKCYYIKRKKHPDPVYICKVNNLNTEYIETMAEWKNEELKQTEVLNSWN